MLDEPINVMYRENKCGDKSTPVDRIDSKRPLERLHAKGYGLPELCMEVSVRRNMAETHLLNCPQKFLLSFKKIYFLSFK